jgi:hypothetical protein
MNDRLDVPKTSRWDGDFLSVFDGRAARINRVNAYIPDSEEEQRQQRFLSLFLPEQGTIHAFIRSIVWDRDVAKICSRRWRWCCGESWIGTILSGRSARGRAASPPM